MKRPPLFCPKRGSALVITLSFLVILCVVVVAYFGLAMSNRQIADNSASLTKVELFAMGAMDGIIADLRQEIADGSDEVKNADGTKVLIYNPKTAKPDEPSPFIRPALTDAGAAPNVVKWSASGKAFYAGAAAEAQAATAVSSTTPSRNGRCLSPARWNKALLLPKANPASDTDVTPDGFTAPDWVLCARDGSHPTALSAEHKAGGTNAVTARYAFVIYDEGGLLDANVAGLPLDGGGKPEVAAGRKGGAAFADLTLLPGVAGLAGSRPAEVANALVGWRNFATAQPGGSLAGGYTFSGEALARYTQAMRGGSGGFLTTSGAPLADGGNGKQSDRMFASRQELIHFLTRRVAADAGERANLQTALQYLGTFTRDLNRPVFTPAVSSTVSKSLNPAPLTYPSVRSRVVQDAIFTGGTNAGKPVMAQRFDLSRLAIFSEPDVRTNPQKLAYVRHYFGLTPSADGYAWDYCVHDSGNSKAVGANNVQYLIRPLSGVPEALDKLTAPREAGYPPEPNFFEVLQAAILEGSLQWWNQDTTKAYVPNRPLEASILQIGANLIDQFDADSQPTNINFTLSVSGKALPSNAGQRLFVSGAENLPYFNEMLLWVYRPDDPEDGSFRFRLKAYLLPELWNPHQAAASGTGFTPTALRLQLDLRPNFRLMMNKTYGNTADKPLAIVVPTNLSGQNRGTPPNDVFVEFQNSGDFREPRVVSSAQGAADNTYWKTETETTSQPDGSTTTGESRSGFLVADDRAPDRDLAAYLGYTGPALPDTYTKATLWGDGLYVRLQFKDAGGAWRDYQGTFDYVANAPVSLALSEGQFNGVTSVYSPFNEQFSGVISFEQFRATPAGSFQADDPRRGGLFSSQHSTLNLSLRPQTAMSGTSGNISGAKAERYVPRLWTDYFFPFAASGWEWPKANGPYPAMYNENAEDGENAYLKRNPGAKNTYLRDMDGVLRPGDGFHGADPYLSGAAASRPILLNRPFCSVGDMGYAHRGLAWKSLNFFSAESGDAGLLELFSVDAAPVSAGKINLNTRQAPVLAAMLLGADKMESQGATPADNTLGRDAANELAAALVARTGTAPLMSRADLVRGLLRDKAVTDLIEKAGIADTANQPLKARRESFVRALADAGSTRTWNLMIDLVAQVGRYPAQAANAGDFVVGGERRYWLHVAIDRYTGEIVDQQLEPVYE